MIRHVWTVFCSRALTDKETNNVSLIDVVERLAVEVPSDAPPQFGINTTAVLVTLWARSQPREGTRGKSRTRLLAPNGSEIWASEDQDIDLTKTSRLRVHAKVNVFPMQGSGWYEIEVARELVGGEWETVGRVPVELAVNLSGGLAE
jgi:hypothetical protein